MVRSIVFLTAAALAMVPAQAGTREGRFATEETGRTKCSEFLAARNAKSPSFGRMMGFVDGYISAANRYEPNTYDLAPWQSTAAFSIILQNHCAKNADDALVIAAQKLVEAMRPTRLTEYSLQSEVKSGKQSLSIYDTVLQQVQFTLTRKGLYKGPVKGEFNPETKLALQKFQRENKLAPTGLPDAATLWVLFNTATPA